MKHSILTLLILIPHLTVAMDLVQTAFRSPRLYRQQPREEPNEVLVFLDENSDEEPVIMPTAPPLPDDQHQTESSRLLEVHKPFTPDPPAHSPVSVKSKSCCAPTESCKKLALGCGIMTSGLAALTVAGLLFASPYINS